MSPKGAQTQPICNWLRRLNLRGHENGPHGPDLPAPSPPDDSLGSGRIGASSGPALQGARDFYKQVELDYPVSLGDYQRAQTPDDPMILHMCHVHHSPDIQGPEQWREARLRLLTTPFDVFEHHVRDQLDQALSSAGFDAERDIHAITVNRWPHGYAYGPGLL